MAEYCYDCFKKMFKKKHYKKRHLVLDWDLCEGCADIKKCVTKIRYKPIKFFKWWL